jgi:hypothetical protein
MSSVVISGDTSGAITLAAPAVAGTNTITLPAQTATIATLTTPSFATTIGVGGATAAASGAGITFPASQSASSDANTLDDYEEGTWTPNQGAALTIVGTFNSSGTYTKIGRIVTVSARYNPSTSVSSLGGGNAMSTNLPFVGARNELGTVTNDAQNITGGCLISESQILSTSVITSTSNIYWSLTYITS